MISCKDERKFQSVEPIGHKMCQQLRCIKSIQIMEAFVMNYSVRIKGMSCQHCVMAVKKALSSLDGVTGVEVNLDKGEALINHDAPIDLEDVRKQI